MKIQWQRQNRIDQDPQRGWSDWRLVPTNVQYCCGDMREKYVASLFFCSPDGENIGWNQKPCLVTDVYTPYNFCPFCGLCIEFEQVSTVKVKQRVVTVETTTVKKTEIVQYEIVED